jgi:hypothetical protein
LGSREGVKASLAALFAADTAASTAQSLGSGGVGGALARVSVENSLAQTE